MKRRVLGIFLSMALLCQVFGGAAYAKGPEKGTELQQGAAESTETTETENEQPLQQLTVEFYGLDEKGAIVMLAEQTVTATDGQTLSQAGMKFPEMKSNYPGMQQTG